MIINIDWIRCTLKIIIIICSWKKGYVHESTFKRSVNVPELAESVEVFVGSPFAWCYMTCEITK